VNVFAPYANAPAAEAGHAAQGDWHQPCSGAQIEGNARQSTAICGVALAERRTVFRLEPSGRGGPLRAARFDSIPSHPHAVR